MEGEKEEETEVVLVEMVIPFIVHHTPQRNATQHNRMQDNVSVNVYSAAFTDSIF